MGEGPPSVTRGAAESPRFSLRLKLTVWVVAIYTVIQWTTGGVLWLYQASSIERVSNARLLERAEDLTGLVAAIVPGVDRERLDEIAREQSRFMRFETLSVDVLGRDGASVVPGGDGPVRVGEVPVARLLSSGRESFFRLRRLPSAGTDSAERADAEPPLRAVGLTMLGADLEPYVLVVASSDAFARSQLGLVRRVVLISALAGPLAAAVSGWFIAGIAVAPFERLRRMASDFGPDSLNRSLRIEPVSTEVAELTEQLEQARRRIRDAFKAQDRFLSNISHEIKTPIAVIAVEAETLDLGSSPAEVADFVESAREEMMRLGKLVESFLTLARLQEGSEGSRAQRYAANDLVMDAVEHNASMAGQAGVRLTAELLSDEGTMGTAVRGDPELLRTMLDNLIRNAIRFTQPGGRVVAAVGLVPGGVEVSVLDEGPGIPEGQIDTVFDRFAQAANQDGRAGGGRGGGVNRPQNGHGLGLAIARGIAEMHGGSIAAENRATGGCVFRVRLPIAPDTSGNPEV